jgi:hypothetical protein
MRRVRIVHIALTRHGGIALMTTFGWMFSGGSAVSTFVMEVNEQYRAASNRHTSGIHIRMS